MRLCLFRGALASLPVTLLVGAATWQAAAQDGKLVGSAVVTLRAEFTEEFDDRTHAR